MRADNARNPIADGGEKNGEKIHKMYSNRSLNLSHVPGLGLFSSKEEKTHTASARTCVCTHTNALSYKRVSPCAVPDYGQRTVCVLRSVYMYALVLICPHFSLA